MERSGTNGGRTSSVQNPTQCTTQGKESTKVSHTHKYTGLCTYNQGCIQTKRNCKGKTVIGKYKCYNPN